MATGPGGTYGALMSLVWRHATTPRSTDQYRWLFDGDLGVLLRAYVQCELIAPKKFRLFDSCDNHCVGR